MTTRSIACVHSYASSVYLRSPRSMSLQAAPGEITNHSNSTGHSSQLLASFPLSRASFLIWTCQCNDRKRGKGEKDFMDSEGL
ncbi:unnamed protein product [Mycena citricolor]|uniref:Uncharacterized protein n=1 Tax=Mycena citricolor TaxID=2018698 RepID=A0AAD2HYH7_9AGAR|nr:unnamed protein product [Mycena citricolor]